MSILKIARLGHPGLLQKCKPIKDITSVRVKKIIHDMTETMLDAKGIGLAAPQVHINKQIIIFRNPEDDIEKQIRITALINPSISKINSKTDNKWEGCLSIPGMQGLVRRFKKIKYSGFDLDGKVIENEVESLHARVVQHEVDHLNGILYTSRLANKNAFGFEKEITTYWKNEQNRK